MPALDGTGPAGAGAKMGRGRGPCSGAYASDRAAAFGCGRGLGLGFRRGGGGPGRGFGRGIGSGRRLGWFAVGFGEAQGSAGNNIREVLEERKNFLQAELDRTETLLKSAKGASADSGDGARTDLGADQ